MATIKDVAKRAGVSMSTASYALNGSEKVLEKTRKKVLKAAKELNYTPNYLARGLKKNRNDLIAFAVDEVFGPFYDYLLKGIQDSASIAGYNLVIFLENGGGKTHVGNFLKEHRVDGVILMSARIPESEIRDIHGLNIPMVLLNRKLEGEDISTVVIDNRKGAMLAVQHLFGLGHRKIGFIRGPDDSYDARERHAGFLDALQHFGLAPDATSMLQGDFTELSGYEAMKKSLERPGEKPTAFFSSNDEMLLGALGALREKGVRVPCDMSLVGFDDIKELKYIHPAITSIRRPMYELGSHTAHMLLNMIKRNVGTGHVQLDVRLVVRSSTAPVASGRESA
ncbi:MAG TPA: LacI family DNA-binding transcriptional regulator [Thermotogota bacterium]|nr:LacI family DNA-binding transcriptional regulator [Thermotogota bacterium]HRW93092.1 LacI family DNA-binding transcriptional regulator [Thermotogota bacterium]